MAALSYTKTGAKSTGNVSLDKSVFGLDVKSTQLLKQVYLASQANARNNVAHVKTRGEVRGGGRKPWRQKGTGRARFGSSRNPIWRGGGAVFGPRTKDNHSLRTSSGLRKQALRQALSLAAGSGRISVIEALPASGKTAELKKILAKIGFDKGLVIVAAQADKLIRASRNLADVRLVYASQLSAGDVLDSYQILIEKPALEVISERLKG